MNYLVCPNCQVKEVINSSNFGGCKVCGEARYAEDENGNCLIMWSTLNDTNNFDIWTGEEVA